MSYSEFIGDAIVTIIAVGGAVGVVWLAMLAYYWARENLSF